VRQTLKKNEIKPHLRKMWCIPPEHNAEFVCAMENVLEVYKRPHDRCIAWCAWMKSPSNW